jgi:hypothetical protein
VVLSLPAWTPGAYELSHFARWVSNFEAADAGGRALAWEKADADSWRVRPGRAGRVRVRFDYRADSLDNAMAWSRADFLMFNGTNLFLYPEGQPLDRYPATVRVATEPGWRVATGMAAGRGAERVRGAQLRRPRGHALLRGALRDRQRRGERAVDAARHLPGRQRERGAARGRPRLAAPADPAPGGGVRRGAVAELHGAADRRPAYGGAAGLEHQNSHVDVVASGALDEPFLPGSTRTRSSTPST